MSSDWFVTWILNPFIRVVQDTDWPAFWIQFAVAVGTLALAFFAAFEIIRKYFWKPKIVFDYHEKFPYISTPKMFFFEDEKKKKIVAAKNTIYLHVSVSNKRRTQAKDVSIEMTEIWRWNGKQYDIIPSVYPLELKWAGLDNATVTINKGQVKYIDIGFVVEPTPDPRNDDTSKPDFVIGHLNANIQDITTRLKPKEIDSTSKYRHGKYVIKITAYGSNVTPTPSWWELEWSGRFVQGIGKIKDELKFTRVPDRIARGE